MKLNFKSSTALLVFVVLTTGCGSAMPEYQDQRGTTSSADAEACTKKTTKLQDVDGDVEFSLLAAPDYTTVIKPQLLDMHCTAACHAPGKVQATVDLSTYAGAKNFYAASLADMQAGTMPTGGGAAVSPAKIALFQQWQAAGFPEKAADVPPVGATPTPAPGATPATTGTTTGGAATTGSGTTTGTTGTTSTSAKCLL